MAESNTNRPGSGPTDRKPDACRWCGSAVSVHCWPGGVFYRCKAARCAWWLLVDGEGAIEQAGWARGAASKKGVSAGDAEAIHADPASSYGTVQVFVTPSGADRKAAFDHNAFGIILYSGDTARIAGSKKLATIPFAHFGRGVVLVDVAFFVPANLVGAVLEIAEITPRQKHPQES